MKTVAILYICTGKYDVFWKDFYLSYEQFFLNNCKKDYYVFTDAKKLDFEENENVHKIFQKSLGWPDNTLLRFHIFSQCFEELSNYDYIFFMNANCQCVSNISEEEFLPQKEDLLVVKHPGFFDKKNYEYTYDRNPKSLAYVAEGQGKYYICGGVNGGKSAAYINLMKTLKDNIEIDRELGIVALWHDESHINKYIISNSNYRILSPSFCFPEDSNLPFEEKIRIREKKKWIDVDTVKNGNKRLKLFKKILKLRINQGITIVYQGGLGNQMFQYVLRCNYENSNNKIYDDLSHYRRNIDAMPFRLTDVFQNIELNPFEENPIRLYIKKNRKKNILYRILFKFFLKHKKLCVEPEEFRYSSECTKMSKAHMVGFWQSYKYVENVSKIIKDRFVFKKIEDCVINAYEEKMRNENSVSIHIRAGDYLSDQYIKQYGNICTVDYYKNAIKHMKSNMEHPRFYVFSNDIEWCKQNIIIENVVWMEDLPEHDDWVEMYLMTCCKHNIIANSTFSWWAAWLNANSEKIVIAPKRWMNTITEYDLCPKEWIRIEG